MIPSSPGNKVSLISQAHVVHNYLIPNSQDLRWLYDRRDLKEAQQDLHAWLKRWAQLYPRLTGWVEAQIGETLNFYRLPR